MCGKCEKKVGEMGVEYERGGVVYRWKEWEK